MYPVTESTDSKKNLVGKSCKTGYDSHYVLVKNFDSSKPLDYQPCNPEENIPDYDEVVVFNKDQVLPRYLVYYSRLSKKSSRATTKYNSHILWVDPNVHNNKEIIDSLQEKGIEITTFETSSSLRSWLSLNYQINRTTKFGVISNRTREGDGDECAGVRLFQWLRQKGSEYAHFPFLLFCGNPKLVEDLPKEPNVFVTNDVSVLRKFALGLHVGK